MAWQVKPEDKCAGRRQQQPRTGVDVLPVVETFMKHEVFICAHESEQGGHKQPVDAYAAGRCQPQTAVQRHNADPQQLQRCKGRHRILLAINRIEKPAPERYCRQHIKDIQSCQQNRDASKAPEDGTHTGMERQAYGQEASPQGIRRSYCPEQEVKRHHRNSPTLLQKDRPASV